jgi:hypothetical protein
MVKFQEGGPTCGRIDSQPMVKFEGVGFKVRIVSIHRAGFERRDGGSLLVTFQEVGFKVRIFSIDKLDEAGIRHYG